MANFAEGWPGALMVNASNLVTNLHAMQSCLRCGVLVITDKTFNAVMVLCNVNKLLQSHADAVTGLRGSTDGLNVRRSCRIADFRRCIRRMI